jgi:hypothetical protein
VSATALLLVLSPFLLLAVILGTVMTVALWRARQDDVPEVLRTFTLAFCYLVDRVPGRRRTLLTDDFQEPDEDTDSVDNDGRRMR